MTPTRTQIEPHLQTLLDADPEHARLVSALHAARAALGDRMTPEVLAYIDASTDLLTYDAGVEGALMWHAGKTLGEASGDARNLGGEADMDPVELALALGVETLQAR